MSEPTATAPRSPWAPFRRRVFLALWIASVASNMGGFLADVGGAWLMSSLAPSPLLIALITTAASLPYFFLALPAGALADVVDRRRLLIVTQVIQAAVAVALGVLTVLGIMTPWRLLALTFLMGVGSAINDPAWAALTPDMLPRDDLPAGIALNSVGFNLARALGPALGGVLVAAAGAGASFFANAASFLGVVLVLFLWKNERQVSVLPGERMLSAMRAGVRFARHGRALQKVILRAAGFLSCSVALLALLPVLATKDLAVGASGYGLLLGSMGAGAVVGASVLPRLRARLTTDSLVAIGSLVLAGVFAVLGLVRELPILCPVTAVGGVAWTTVLSSLNVSAQRSSPGWVKARALAVYLLSFQAVIAAGSAVWGWVAQHEGTGTAFLAAGAGLVASVVLLAPVRVAPDEDVDYTPTQHWPDPVVRGEPRLEDGPVMVTVVYRIDPARAEEFVEAVRPLGLARRRDGAVEWFLFRDVAEPGRFVETWFSETWAEHLREHERVSGAMRDLEDAVHAFHVGPEPPAVTHLLHAPPPRST
ncbi:MAG TPA: MFS transporter [Planctomycetota bacterium]|nr:MFS transporter [Planctomycetota bacterium]